MTAAHDSAMAQLGIAPDHPLTGKLAANIAALAAKAKAIRLSFANWPWQSSGPKRKSPCRSTAASRRSAWDGCRQRARALATM
jgi:hypothetical protein